MENDGEPIMEMSEEYSERSQNIGDEFNRNQSWQDIYFENEQLKIQITS